MASHLSLVGNHEVIPHKKPLKAIMNPIIFDHMLGGWNASYFSSTHFYYHGPSLQPVPTIRGPYSQLQGQPETYSEGMVNIIVIACILIMVLFNHRYK